MKHITLFILLAISSLLVNAQGWMWAKHFNGTGSNQPVSISQDNVGNYYVYGNFKNQVTQDAITLNSYSGSQDIFLAKYNPLGEVQWIKQIGGTGTETAYSLCFNSDYSSFYITGNFSIFQSSAHALRENNLIFCFYSRVYSFFKFYFNINWF